MKRPLLPKSSIVYLRRLAKELNKLEGGFYVQGKRWHGATACIGYPSNVPSLRINRRGDDGYAMHSTTIMAGLDTAVFTDGNGREVCASRTAPRSTKAKGL